MCTYIKSKQRLFSYSLCSRFVKTIKNWEPKNHTPKVEKIVPPPSRSTTRGRGRSRTIAPPDQVGHTPNPGRVLKDTSFFSLFAAGFLNVFVFQVVRLWREWRESRNTTE